MEHHGHVVYGGRLVYWLNEFLRGEDRSNFVGLATSNFGRLGPRRCKESICVSLGGTVMSFFVSCYLLCEVCLDGSEWSECAPERFWTGREHWFFAFWLTRVGVQAPVLPLARLTALSPFSLFPFFPPPLCVPKPPIFSQESVRGSQA